MPIDTSIIITNFNREKYIGRAIRSCLHQKNKTVEVIVVDDASTDNSRDLITGYPVIPIFLKKNVGVAEASNVGIRKASGRYVMRVDADDYIAENTVFFLSEILNHNHDIGFVYSDHIRVDEQENFIKRVDLNTLELLLRHGAGVLFRKSYLEAIGLYDKKLRNAEDHDLIQRYIKNWDGYHLPLPLYRYRQHPEQMTADDEERKRWEKIADENRK